MRKIGETIDELRKCCKLSEYDNEKSKLQDKTTKETMMNIQAYDDKVSHTEKNKENVKVAQGMEPEWRTVNNRKKTTLRMRENKIVQTSERKNKDCKMQERVLKKEKSEAKKTEKADIKVSCPITKPDLKSHERDEDSTLEKLQHLRSIKRQAGAELGQAQPD